MTKVPTDRDAQLRWLVDRAAVYDLFTEFCWHLDGRQWDQLADHFLPEGGIVFPFGTVRQPRFAEFASTILAGYPLTNHLIANFRCDVDGDVAKIDVNLRAAHTPNPDDMTLHADVDGRYTAEAHRLDTGEWKFLRVEALFVALSGQPFEAPTEWEFDEKLEFETA